MNGLVPRPSGPSLFPRSSGPSLVPRPSRPSLVPSPQSRLRIAYSTFVVRYCKRSVALIVVWERDYTPGQACQLTSEVAALSEGDAEVGVLATKRISQSRAGQQARMLVRGTQTADRTKPEIYERNLWETTCVYPRVTVLQYIGSPASAEPC